MALHSQLLRGDSKLEAAATLDPAHITPGARGPHVSKIQAALNLVDSFNLEQDSVYGQKTATAVLTYKQKRKIINRGYQSKADNIVGKMTIAALDAELLSLEGATARPLWIVSVHPRATARYRSASHPTFRPTATPQSKLGAKTFADTKSPQIVVPGRIPQIMELQENRIGSFEIVDGTGGTVASWDNSVGMVFDPAEPQAHGGTMRITRSPQRFSVMGRKIGQTFIEARRGGNSPFPTGDLLSLAVVAPTTKLTWRPTWSPKIGRAMTVEPWASQAFGPPAVGGVMLKSPLVEFIGSVDPDESIRRSDFEIGILQTMILSQMVAEYADAGGRPFATLTISGPNTPTRDTSDNSPLWYDGTEVKSVDAPAGNQVSTNDSPQMVVPWRTQDGKGGLTGTSGGDRFITWLTARQKSTGTLIPLAWVMWAVDWGARFDVKTEKRTLTTGSGTITGQGDDGEGPLSPVTKGQTAIQQTTMRWAKL